MKKKIAMLLTIYFTVCAYGKEEELYLLNLNYPGLGNVCFYMNFEIKDNDRFLAYTNDKAVYNMIPFYQKTYLKLFGEGKKRGAAMRILNGEMDKKEWRGDVKSVFGEFLFKAKKIEGGLKGTLSNQKIVLDFTAKKVESKKTLMNYNELYDKITTELNRNVFNPRILAREDWKSFLNNLKKALFQAEDDLDVLLSYFYLSSKVKTSHLYLTKIDPLLRNNVVNTRSYEYKQLEEDIGELKITQFSLDDYKEIHDLIHEIKVPYLVVDLTSCLGGDFSSLLFASNFVDKEYLVGFFLGNKYYEKNEKIPDFTTIKGIKPFTKGDLDDFYARIDNEGILVGKVIPSEKKFEGKVFILTSSNTASAAEPLVYFIKQNELGTIVGEKTAGQMLSARSFKLSDNWYLTLPVADYFTMDNINLDQVGVKPHIEVENNQALEEVMTIIREGKLL